MAITARLTLNIEHDGENKLKQILETRNIIDSKLSSDGHWVVPVQNLVFLYGCDISKIATTTILGKR
jgi:uncharacterized spore protein YtfJ